MHFHRFGLGNGEYNTAGDARLGPSHGHSVVSLDVEKNALSLDAMSGPVDHPHRPAPPHTLQHAVKSVIYGRMSGKPAGSAFGRIIDPRI